MKVDDSNRNDAKGPQGPPGIVGLDTFALLRKPAIVGAAAAVGGLLVGIAIGRASVDRQASQPPAVATVDGRLTVNRSPDGEEAVQPEGPKPWYSLYFGRALPPSARGFERVRGAARPVSRLLGKEASVELELDPKPGAYVVTIVASLESAKAGTLTMDFDGHALSTIELGKDWQMYSAPLPAESIGPGKTHTLALRVEGAGENPTLRVDSLAVAPVGSEASLEMGTASAVGALVDGFGTPSASHVWNHGERSLLGVVLQPVAGDYRLTVKASTLPQLDPLTVTGKVNGTSVGTVVVERYAAEVSWPVPASVLRAGINRIEFSYPKTLKPSDLKPNSKDDRPLAVRFKQIALKPAR